MNACVPSRGLEKRSATVQHPVVETTSIDELLEELEAWRTYAKEIGAQLAAARKEIARLKDGKAPGDAPGFDRFWSAWPSSSRKVNKQACKTRWLAEKLEDQADAIVEHVEACKLSQDWTKDGGRFVPAPLVYLRQDRFLAPPPAAARSVGSLKGITYTTEGIGDDGSFF